MPRPDIREVVLFYPGKPLAQHVKAWALDRADCAVLPVFARSFPAMRSAMSGVDLVVIDATRDCAQAMDAFSQSLTYLGAAATTVYTEVMHEGLELFVRQHGSLLLLGPMGESLWGSFFDHAFRTCQKKRPWRLVA
jgi:hypothetical protein